jgi:hypothetical protein
MTYYSDPAIQRDKLVNNLLDAVYRGEKINCIKWLRALTGLGLKDSKEIVEAFFRQSPPEPSLGDILPRTLNEAVPTPAAKGDSA